MRCGEIKEWMSEHIDGVLDPEREKQLRDHLAECEDCRTELSELERAVALVREVEPVQPPADLLEKIHARLEPAIRTNTGASHKSGPGRITLFLSLPQIRMAMAAGLLVIVGVYGVHIMERSPAPDETTRVRATEAVRTEFTDAPDLREDMDRSGMPAATRDAESTRKLKRSPEPTLGPAPDPGMSIEQEEASSQPAETASEKMVKDYESMSRESAASIPSAEADGNIWQDILVPKTPAGKPSVAAARPAVGGQADRFKAEPADEPVIKDEVVARQTATDSRLPSPPRPEPPEVRRQVAPDEKKRMDADITTKTPAPIQPRGREEAELEAMLDVAAEMPAPVVVEPSPADRESAGAGAARSGRRGHKQDITEEESARKESGNELAAARQAGGQALAVTVTGDPARVLRVIDTFIPKHADKRAESTSIAKALREADTLDDTAPGEPERRMRSYGMQKKAGATVVTVALPADSYGALMDKLRAIGEVSVGGPEDLKAGADKVLARERPALLRKGGPGAIIELRITILPKR